jgi:hypothetical protein
MNAKEYVEKFCNKNYDKLSYDLTWINFNGKKYYVGLYLTEKSELFLDKTNNFLKIHYPYLYINGGFEHIIDEIIYNKILER